MEIPRGNARIAMVNKLEGHASACPQDAWKCVPPEYRTRETRPSIRIINMSNEIVSEGYLQLLNELKERIRTTQLRSIISVNRELILLYWHIGQEILQRQQTEGWGSKVIDRLAKDLRHEFP
jgi:hypothetical protein